LSQTFRESFFAGSERLWERPTTELNELFIPVMSKCIPLLVTSHWREIRNVSVALHGGSARSQSDEILH
jgi:hypothetical protein